MDQIVFLDYAGIAVFAATGALSASRKELDIIGFLFLAAITGVGGGTVRDLILGVPVFWVVNHDYLAVCAAVALIVYFTAHRIESRYKLLLWLDAVGLAAYAVYGAWKGLVVTGSAPVAIVTGMLTATLGGILRDQIAGEPSVLMRQEIYVTAAMAGAVAFSILGIAGLPTVAAALAAFAIAFLIRAGAIRYGWSIPTYRSRPGRRPEDIP
ncbi:MAG TPA: trimeric intracellular cation channel family protein [Aquamicrobium sp.]|jgi:uncharacterized membrane protein YeiH|nr:trimeric intracellular cation channel family protein [Aquamicrobium sp.]